MKNKYLNLFELERLKQWNDNFPRKSESSKLLKKVLKGLFFGAAVLGSLCALEKGCEREDAYEQQKEQYIKDVFPKEPYSCTFPSAYRKETKNPGIEQD